MVIKTNKAKTKQLSKNLLIKNTSHEPSVSFMDTFKGSLFQLSIIFKANKTSDNKHYSETVCFFLLAFSITVALVSVVVSGVIFLGPTQSLAFSKRLCRKESHPQVLLKQGPSFERSIFILAYILENSVLHFLHQKE